MAGNLLRNWAAACVVVGLLTLPAGCGDAATGQTSSTASAVPAAWAVGQGGAILVAKDGTHWTAQRSGTTKDLAGVAFADASHGWAVGDHGTILATTDGGAHWFRQRSGTTKGLSGIACSDAQHAWAVGPTTQAILATTNGGTTWTTQRAGTDVGVEAVACTDSRHAWAAGDDTIVSTSDGGARWHLQWNGHLRLGVEFSGVACADVDHVWAVGLSGLNNGGLPTRQLILASSNGGDSWTRQTAGNSEGWSGVAAFDHAHVWVVTGRGLSAHTTNGGATWRQTATSRQNDLTSVAFFTDARGWAVGYVFPPASGTSMDGVILGTSDGGVTWLSQRALKGRGLVAVCCVHSGHGGGP
jgi:photosystem II stability/assembly factor-like uncharacterized protein